MAYRIEGPEVMTPGEAALALGVSATTVRRWADSGTLSQIRTVGGHRRYRRTEVERLLNTMDEGVGERSLAGVTSEAEKRIRERIAALEAATVTYGAWTIWTTPTTSGVYIASDGSDTIAGNSIAEVREKITMADKPCSICNGHGTIPVKTTDKNGKWITRYDKCQTCNGTGKRL